MIRMKIAGLTWIQAGEPLHTPPDDRAGSDS
jgi:hypothetical protein